MILYILRKDGDDVGQAFPRRAAAIEQAVGLDHGEIVRANIPLRGQDLLVALFNRELGDNVRTVAVVEDGRVLVLNQKNGPEQSEADTPDAEETPGEMLAQAAR